MRKYKSATLLFIILFFCTTSFSQKKTKHSHIDKIILEIPDSLTSSTEKIASYINQHFENQEEKARAIFSWITENIAYDYKNIYAFGLDHDIKASTKDILIRRKGVCQDYAKLFRDIALTLDIKTFIVSGYTKTKDEVDYNPHSWCASKIENQWYLFDPTWGAGYIQNSQFIKEVDYSYFKVMPEKFIKTHIPFDPLWQFSHFPLTKHQFETGKTSLSNSFAFFNYSDTIRVYESQASIERYNSVINRIIANGVSNYMVYSWLHSLKNRIDDLHEINVQHQYNKAFNSYSTAMSMLNQFINYQNDYFLPYKSDLKVRSMLDSIQAQFNQSIVLLKEIQGSSLIIENYVKHLEEAIKGELVKLNNRKEKLTEYLKVAKKYRQSLRENKP